MEEIKKSTSRFSKNCNNASEESSEVEAIGKEITLNSEKHRHQLKPIINIFMIIVKLIDKKLDILVE